jgi:hypothetical protein
MWNNTDSETDDNLMTEFANITSICPREHATRQCFELDWTTTECAL